MFLQYVAMFCVNTLLILGMVILLFLVLDITGAVIPANYAEQKLQDNAFGIGELRARVAAHLRRESREKKRAVTVNGVQFYLCSQKDGL